MNRFLQGLGWTLVALGFYGCADMASQGLDPDVGGAGMVMTTLLFVLPGALLIRWGRSRGKRRQEQRDDMAEAIATAIRKDREGR